ncbi:MAG: hypothetical protein IJ518_03030 [Clostridia bacterium]|nr:hypothetical protein [Clostridia bacterium]
MRKLSVFLLIFVLGVTLAGCGGAPQEASEPDYSALIVPPVDLTITDCISEQELSTVLGYTMTLLGVGEEGSQAVYQTEDGTCIVTVHMLNQTRAGFDAMVNASAVPMVLQEGLGESAYWYGDTAQLMLYSGGYAVDVSVVCVDISEPNSYVLQIAESILSRLPQDG